MGYVPPRPQDPDESNAHYIAYLEAQLNSAQIRLAVLLVPVVLIVVVIVLLVEAHS